MASWMCAVALLLALHSVGGMPVHRTEISAQTRAPMLGVDQTDSEVQVHSASSGSAEITVIPRTGAVGGAERVWMTISDAADTGDAGHCTHLPTSGICTGVFIGTTTATHLVGCFGDATSCERSSAPALFACRSILAENPYGTEAIQSVQFVAPAADDVKIVHYSTAAATGRTSCYNLALEPVSSDSACPIITATSVTRTSLADVLDYTFVRSSVSTSSLPTKYAIGPVILGSTDRTAHTLALPGWVLGRWTSVVATTPHVSEEGESELCVSEVEVATMAPPFRVDVEYAMTPPAKKLIVSTPQLIPEITDSSIISVLSVYDGDAIVDSAYRGNTYPAHALRLGNCRHTHRLEIVFLSTDGNIIYNTSLPVHPAAACASEGLPLDCFCEMACDEDGDSNRDGMAGMDDPDCQLTKPTMVSTGPPTVPVFAELHIDHEIDGPHPLPGIVLSELGINIENENACTQTAQESACAAVNLDDGSVTRGTVSETTTGTHDTDGIWTPGYFYQCILDLAPGVYTIYHGVGQSAADVEAGHVGTCGRIVTGVEVCTIGRPTIGHDVPSFGTAPAAIFVNSGMVCKLPPVIPTAYQVSWDFADSHTGIYNAPMRTDGDIIWAPGRNHYIAHVHWPEQHGGTNLTTPPYTISDKAHDFSPRPCHDLTATITPNRVPRFESDHEAAAVIHIDGTPIDDERIWSVRIATSSGEAHWYEMARTTGSLPEDYEFQLRAGVSYAVRLMVMTHTVAPVSAALFANDLCYIDGGRVDALSPVEIHVLSPISLVECPGSLVVVDVEANIELPIPSCGYTDVGLDDVNYDTATGLYTHRFVIGGVDISASPDLLVLTFDFGLNGIVTNYDLRDIVTMQLYPSAARFHVLDPDPFEDTDHFGTDTNVDPYHCEATGHNLTLTVINHTPFGYLVDVAGHVGIGHPFAGERRHLTPEVMPPSIVDPKPVTVTVTLHTGNGAADVVRRMCPDRVLQYAVPPYLSTAARVTPAEVVDTDSHEEMCLGKRLFQIDTDMPTPNPLLYFTQNDPDLGTGQVMDGGAYYLTVDRTEPVVLYIHHSVDDHHVGVTTGCTITIPAAKFADHWVPASPTASMASSKPSGCHPVGASEAVSGSGELLVATSNAQTVQLIGPRGTVYHSGYPTVPPGGKYLYQQLPTGIYTMRVSAASTSPGGESVPTEVVCTRDRAMVVTNTADYSDIVDTDETSYGNHKMVCPRELYGGTHAWQSYLDIVFKESFSQRWVGDPDNTLTVNVWNQDALDYAPALLYKEAEDERQRASYMLPAPGTYIAEIRVAEGSQGAECRYYLPPLVVEEPMFERGDFLVDVRRYPTCIDANDGVMEISHPPGVNPEGVSISRCTRWDTGASCAHDLEVVRQDDQSLVIRDIPFITTLTLEYDIMGACRFEETYRVLPHPSTHPTDVHVQYEPSCSQTQRLVPMARDPYTQEPVEIYKTAAVDFTWIFYDAQGTRVGDSTAPWLVVGSPDMADADTALLRVKYNGVCETTATFDINDQTVFTPPTVVIDPLVAPVNSESDAVHLSMPVFCPGASDAVVGARITPPFTEGSLLTASDGSVAVPVAMPREDIALLTNVAPGTYEMVYSVTDQHFDIECTVSDTITIPRKDHYAVLSHITVEAARCSGGLAGAKLERHPECSGDSEIEVFTADMVPSSDRQYIKDSGFGSTVITDVPDGHVIAMSVPYPDRYRYRQSDFCPEPLRIDFHKTAPLPLLIDVPHLTEATTTVGVALHVPPWHSHVAFTWADLQHASAMNSPYGSVLVAEAMDSPQTHHGTVVTGADMEGCHQSIEITLPSGSIGQTLVAVPETQVLTCPDLVPDAVSIYSENTITGERALRHVIHPHHFGSFFDQQTEDEGAILDRDYRAGEARFSVATWLPPTVTEYRLLDPECTSSDDLHVGITLEHTTLTSLVSTPECEGTNTELICRAPRRVASTIIIPYATGAGECQLRLPTYRHVKTATAHINEWSVTSNTGGCTGPFAIGVPEFDANVPDVLPGVTMVDASKTGLMGSICLASFPVPVAHSVQGAAPVEVVQLIPTTCAGENDAVAVIAYKDGIEDQETEAEWYSDTGESTTVPFVEGRAVITGIGPGTGWLNVPYPGSNCPSTTMVTVPSRPDPVIVVQPQGLPPPPHMTSSAVLGIRDVSNQPVPVNIFINNAVAGALLRIRSDRIVSDLSLAGEPMVTEAPVMHSDFTDWPFIHTVDLHPGYSHDISVVCKSVQRRRSSTTVRINPAAAPRLRCEVLAYPTSPHSRDGSVKAVVLDGVGPYIYHWHDLAAGSSTSANVEMRTDMGNGAYMLTAHDTNSHITDASHPSCTFDLNPLTTFDIHHIEVDHTIGCGAQTKGVLHVHPTGGARPTLAGAWNEAVFDPVIDSCSDPRMQTPEFVDEEANVVALTVGAGQWLVALCDGGTVVSSAPSLAAVVVAVTTSMTVTPENGELCTSVADGRLVVKTLPKLLVGNAQLPITVTGPADFSEAVTTIVTPLPGGTQHEVALDGLKSGMYMLSVTDALNCPVQVKVINSDTGAGPCGSCDPRDKTCFGCDSVPFSGKKVDICGVCGGTESCHDDCMLNVLTTMANTLEEIHKCAAARRPIIIKHRMIFDGIKPDTDGMDVEFISSTGKYDFRAPLADIILSARSVHLTGLHITEGVTIVADEVVIKDCHVDGATVTIRHPRCGGRVDARIVQSEVYNSRIVVVNSDVPCTQAAPLSRRASEPDAGELESLLTIIGGLLNNTVVGGDNVVLSISDITVDDLGLFGSSDNITIDPDEDLEIIDIGDFTFSNQTQSVTVCILFREFSTLKTIITTSREYQRHKTECTVFGGPSTYTNFQVTNMSVYVIYVVFVMGAALLYMFVTEVANTIFVNKGT